MTKGPAPFHSRMSSADHSIIAPSIRSAPIGTRHISDQRRRRQREAPLRLLGRRLRIVGDQPQREEDGRRGEERLQHQLLGEEADPAGRRRRAISAPTTVPKLQKAWQRVMIRRPSTRSVWLALAFIDTSIVAIVSPQRKSARPSAERVRRQRRPDEAEEEAEPPQTAVRRVPMRRMIRGTLRKPEHGAERHAEEAEGERQHVEPERLLDVRDARKPDREAERVQREDQLQRRGGGRARRTSGRDGVLLD